MYCILANVIQSWVLLRASTTTRVAEVHFFLRQRRQRKKGWNKKMSVNESCRTRRRSFCCIGFKTERLMGTRGRPFQMHRERDRRKKRGWKRHTHTLRHIETRDRLKIAAKIDGKRIMLKASGQWRHAYRNQPTALDREKRKERKRKKQYPFLCQRVNRLTHTHIH